MVFSPDPQGTRLGLLQRSQLQRRGTSLLRPFLSQLTMPAEERPVLPRNTPQGQAGLATHMAPSRLLVCAGFSRDPCLPSARTPDPLCPVKPCARRSEPGRWFPASLVLSCQQSPPPFVCICQWQGCVSFPPPPPPRGELPAWPGLSQHPSSFSPTCRQALGVA